MNVAIGDKSVLTQWRFPIFFESESLPEDLHPNWNPDNIPYYLKGQWEYENGVPKVKHL